MENVIWQEVALESTSAAGLTRLLMRCTDQVSRRGAAAAASKANSTCDICDLNISPVPAFGVLWRPAVVPGEGSLSEML